jgi:hypothetical protein
MQNSPSRSVSPFATRAAVVAGRLRGLRNRILRRNTFDDLPPPELTGRPETLAHRPAFFEPEHLDRVIACGFGVDRLEEFAKLRADRFTGSPAERYHLGESIIVGGTVITRQARHHYRALPELKSIRSKLQTYDTATLLNTEQGLFYFGHWLQDDCALYELVKDAPNLLSIARPAWPDRAYYEANFGQVWTETSFAHVGDLTVWRDLGYSTDKARRLQALRARLRSSVTPTGNQGVVYISRGRTGEPRNMSNTEAFENALRNAGVEVIDLNTVDLRTGGPAMLDARMIISIEGSQACHGLFALADGGSFLIIQPPERFYNPLRNWASLLGLNYGIVVGQKDEVSFHVDPDEVLRMVDRLLALPSVDAV